MFVTLLKDLTYFIRSFIECCTEISSSFANPKKTLESHIFSGRICTNIFSLFVSKGMYLEDLTRSGGQGGRL
jgi:hypothetical protein